MMLMHRSYKVFFLLLSNFLIVAIKSVESEKIISESIEKAKVEQGEAQKRIDAAKQAKEESKTLQEKQEAELREQEAMKDFYTARIQEQKGVLDLANQKGSAQNASKAQEELQKAEKDQEVVEQKINQLSQDLGKEFVSSVPGNIATDVDLVGYAQNILVGDYSNEMLQKKIGYVQEMQSKIKDFFDDFSIESQLSTQKILQRKFDFFDAKRMILGELLDIVQTERNKLEQRKSTDGISESEKKYQNLLDDMISTITQKKASLNVGRVTLEFQNVSIFSRIMTGIKNWFDKTFDFHKTPWYKRSIDQEIRNLENAKQQVKKIEGVLQDFSLESIQQLGDEVTNLKGDIPFIVDSDLQRNVSDLQQRVDALDVSVISDISKAVSEYDTLYNETLQPMLGDLAAKLKRYKKSEYKTLFDQMIEDYRTDVSGTPYKPEQLYQALFTPEVIEKLNQKNSNLKLNRAMFDPITFDPESIAPELIDQAYEENRKLYPPGTLNFIAARNASVVLRNAVDRVTYNSFLKDYKSLLARGIKDPYTQKTDQESRFLNEQGALSKLEITAQAQAQLSTLYGDVTETITTVVPRIVDVKDAVTKIESVREEMKKLNEEISNYIQQKQQGLIGNL